MIGPTKIGQSADFHFLVYNLKSFQDLQFKYDSKGLQVQSGICQFCQRSEVVLGLRAQR